MEEAQDAQDYMDIGKCQALAPLPAAFLHRLLSCCLPIAFGVFLLLRNKCG